MHNPKLARIKLLLLDVDGVLTDGSITYTDGGEEIKQFNAKDGFGIRLLMNAGVRVGIITGRKSRALVQRCRNLGIDLVFDNVGPDKTKAFAAVLEETGLTASETAFAGDDLPDIPVMTTAGFGFAVADADSHVIRASDFTTSRAGGKGAVREISELILKAQGTWQDVTAPYIP